MNDEMLRRIKRFQRKKFVPIIVFIFCILSLLFLVEWLELDLPEPNIVISIVSIFHIGAMFILVGNLVMIPMRRNLKVIEEKYDLNTITWDINLKKDPNLSKSNIYLGAKVFVPIGTAIIKYYVPIPYVIILWTYDESTGRISDNRTVKIFCEDGMCFVITAHKYELPLLYTQIKKKAPKAIVGYNKQNELLYYEQLDDKERKRYLRKREKWRERLF